MLTAVTLSLALLLPFFASGANTTVNITAAGPICPVGSDGMIPPGCA